MRVLSRKLSPNIPIVLCPTCAKHMRFATFEPTTRDDRYRMTFDCGCGFKIPALGCGSGSAPS